MVVTDRPRRRGRESTDDEQVREDVDRRCSARRRGDRRWSSRNGSGRRRRRGHR